MKAIAIHSRGVFPALIPIPDGKGSWITDSSLSFFSERINDTVLVPTGSHNNLASIPFPARNLFPVNGPHRIAAIVHDHLYEKKGIIHGGITLSRKQCDQIFYDLMCMPSYKYLAWLSSPARMSLRKMPAIEARLSMQRPLVGSTTAALMYRAVRLGGGSHW